MLLLLFTVRQPVKCDQIMRWWSSNLGYWLLQAYALSLIVTKVLFPPPLFASTVVRLTSKGESASCPVLQHRPSRLRTVSSSHLGVPHIRPRIPIPRCLSTGSYYHLSVARVLCLCHVSCHTFPLYAPCWPSYIHAFRIPVVSAPMRLPKYLLAYPSFGHPLLYTATTGPISAPHPRTPSPAFRLWIWSKRIPTVTLFLDTSLCLPIRPEFTPPS